MVAKVPNLHQVVMKIGHDVPARDKRPGRSTSQDAAETYGEAPEVPTTTCRVEGLTLAQGACGVR